MSVTLVTPHVSVAAQGTELVDALRKFGAFVLNAGLEELIAATQLHSHFGFGEDEAILDHVVGSARMIRTLVVPRTEVTPKQAATWGFTPDGESVVLGWSDAANVNDELAAAVAEAGKFLAAEGLTMTLAVMARHDPFAIEPGKMLYEQTNEAARTQLTTVVRRSDVPAEQEAAWRFSWKGPEPRGHILPEDVVLVATRGCDPGCSPKP